MRVKIRINMYRKIESSNTYAGVHTDGPSSPNHLGSGDY